MKRRESKEENDQEKRKTHMNNNTPATLPLEHL